MNDSRDPAAIYAALKKLGRLGDQRLVTYRCRRGCTLLDIVQVPGMRIAHQNRYKLSDAVNEASSSASGRARNTVDGNRRYIPQTYDCEQVVNFTLACDHLPLTPEMPYVAISRERVQRDIAVHRREVTATAADHEPPPYIGETTSL